MVEKKAKQPNNSMYLTEWGQKIRTLAETLTSLSFSKSSALMTLSELRSRTWKKKYLNLSFWKSVRRSPPGWNFWISVTSSEKPRCTQAAEMQTFLLSILCCNFPVSSKLCSFCIFTLRIWSKWPFQCQSVGEKWRFVCYCMPVQSAVNMSF